MGHPMIEARYQKLERELLELDVSYQNAITGQDEEAEERIGRQMDRIERELDTLDMEAADPAVHGYGFDDPRLREPDEDPLLELRFGGGEL